METATTSSAKSNYDSAENKSTTKPSFFKVNRDILQHPFWKVANKRDLITYLAICSKANGSNGKLELYSGVTIEPGCFVGTWSKIAEGSAIRPDGVSASARRLSDAGLISVDDFGKRVKSIRITQPHELGFYNSPGHGVSGSYTYIYKNKDKNNTTRGGLGPFGHWNEHCEGLANQIANGLKRLILTYSNKPDHPALETDVAWAATRKVWLNQIRGYWQTGALHIDHLSNALECLRMQCEHPTNPDYFWILKDDPRRNCEPIWSIGALRRKAVRLNDQYPPTLKKYEEATR